jgi:hypothetical protein
VPVEQIARRFIAACGCSSAARCPTAHARQWIKPGSTSHRSTPVGHPSGGQRQAIAVARTIATNADILVLAEPLDVMEGALILDVIGRLRGARRVSMSIIAHNYAPHHRVLRSHQSRPEASRIHPANHQMAPLLRDSGLPVSESRGPRKLQFLARPAGHLPGRHSCVRRHGAAGDP